MPRSKADLTDDGLKDVVARNRWALLLAALLADYLLNSVGLTGAVARSASLLLTTAIFVGVIGAVDHSRQVDILALALVALFGVFGILGEVSGAAWTGYALVGVSGGILIGGLTITFLQLGEQATSDREKLFSAIFGYLLLAMIWALLFGQIEASVPGAFDLPGPDTGDQAGAFLYFSLVTITTLGYGEITPVLPLARALAGLEAVFGTLYVAVLIGTIVSRARAP